jgi:Nucleotidyl transferase AbiEii toxin, Type IV TA system
MSKRWLLMTRELRNVGASVRARLLDRARKDNGDLQNFLTRYALERLLYRLSLSPEREHFVLKGAMLFIAWLRNPFRPTQDLDLLGSGDDDAAAILQRFKTICTIEVPDDGVVFDVERLRAEPIREEAQYGGVRVKTNATIGGARVPIQIDVGFGDVVTPEPVEFDYPTLLDSPSPRLKAYPPETVVAEKFEALVSIGVANTRMKDFYDLWMMAQYFPFEGPLLATALRRTFERRRTAWPVGAPLGLSEEFTKAKETLWRAFLTRERLGAAPVEFPKLVADLRAFLLPLLAETTPSHWPPAGPWTIQTFSSDSSVASSDG